VTINRPCNIVSAEEIPKDQTIQLALVFDGIYYNALPREFPQFFEVLFIYDHPGHKPVENPEQGETIFSVKGTAVMLPDLLTQRV
jgi:hypothetical protein